MQCAHRTGCVLVDSPRARPKGIEVLGGTIAKWAQGQWRRTTIGGPPCCRISAVGRDQILSVKGTASANPQTRSRPGRAIRDLECRTHEGCRQFPACSAGIPCAPRRDICFRYPLKKGHVATYTEGVVQQREEP
jgi:hypothetical protein